MFSHTAASWCRMQWVAEMGTGRLFNASSRSPTKPNFSKHLATPLSVPTDMSFDQPNHARSMNYSNSLNISYHVTVPFKGSQSNNSSVTLNFFVNFSEKDCIVSSICKVCSFIKYVGIFFEALCSSSQLHVWITCWISDTTGNSIRWQADAFKHFQVFKR